MIDMQVTDDQQQIIDAVALFLAENLPVARHRRRHLRGALDAALLRDIAALGWIGLGVAEDLGGHGLGLIDDMLVCRELGRQLAPLSLLGAVLAARVAAHAGRADLVRQIGAGTARVAVALRCEQLDDAASLLLVDAPAAGWSVGLTGDAVYLLDISALPTLEVLPAADESIDFERRALDAGAARCVVTGVARSETVLLGAAFLAGMAEATRDHAVEYAKQREQFGQAIGGFQAIKHMCADMALRAESAKCLLFYAGIALEKHGAAAGPQVLAAKVIAADASLQNGAANIQVHGGTGFTDEVDAHLYMKRAHVLERVLGTQRAYQARLGLDASFGEQF